MSALLSDAQVRTLMTAAVLLDTCDFAITRAAAETIAEAGELFLAHGRLAPIAASAWPSIHAAAATMAEAERRRPVAANDRAGGSLAVLAASACARVTRAGARA